MTAPALLPEGLHQKVHMSCWHLRVESQLLAVPGGRAALDRALHLRCSVPAPLRAAAAAAATGRAEDLGWELGVW